MKQPVIPNHAHSFPPNHRPTSQPSLPPPNNPTITIPPQHPLQIPHHLLLPPLPTPTQHNTIHYNIRPLLHRQFERVLHGAVVLLDIAAEIGRVVAVDGEGHFGGYVGWDWEVVDCGDAAEGEV